MKKIIIIRSKDDKVKPGTANQGSRCLHTYFDKDSKPSLLSEARHFPWFAATDSNFNLWNNNSYQCTGFEKDGGGGNEEVNEEVLSSTH